MRACGLLIALWAGLAAAIAFLHGRGYDPRLDLAGNLRQMAIVAGDLELPLAGIFAFALLAIGCGLSLVILSGDRDLTAALRRAAPTRPRTPCGGDPG